MACCHNSMKVPEQQARDVRRSIIPFHGGIEGWNRGLVLVSPRAKQPMRR